MTEHHQLMVLSVSWRWPMSIDWGPYTRKLLLLIALFQLCSQEQYIQCISVLYLIYFSRSDHYKIIVNLEINKLIYNFLYTRRVAHYVKAGFDAWWGVEAGLSPGPQTIKRDSTDLTILFSLYANYSSRCALYEKGCEVLHFQMFAWPLSTSSKLEQSYSQWSFRSLVLFFKISGLHPPPHLLSASLLKMYLAIAKSIFKRKI